MTRLSLFNSPPNTKLASIITKQEEDKKNAVKEAIEEESD